MYLFKFKSDCSMDLILCKFPIKIQHCRVNTEIINNMIHDVIILEITGNNVCTKIINLNEKYNK